MRTSAGYKDIDAIMLAQADLVEIVPTDAADGRIPRQPWPESALRRLRRRCRTLVASSLDDLLAAPIGLAPKQGNPETKRAEQTGDDRPQLSDGGGER